MPLTRSDLQAPANVILSTSDFQKHKSYMPVVSFVIAPANKSYLEINRFFISIAVMQEKWTLARMSHCWSHGCDEQKTN